MLDIKFIKDNIDLIKEAVKKKRLTLDLDELLKAEAKRLELVGEVEAMRQKQNEANQKMASRATDKLLFEMQELKKNLQQKEEELKEVMKTWQRLMLEVPNLPDVEVPDGDSDAQNVSLRQVGKPPTFDFEPKNHIDLMTDLDLIDTVAGAKVAGFRGYFLKNAGAILSLAIWQLGLNELVKKGFTPMLVPSLVRKESFMGTGYLPQGIEDLYRTQDDEYLAGTAEVATMGYFMDQVLSTDELPKKIVAFSPCFRREAGSHGKDTKGLYRVHEFFKVEQVVICPADHEESVHWHEALLANAEELMQLLELPYRVVINCSGDLGLGQVKKYDIEVWVPSENRYRETHSISYFHDFQTRRLNIKCQDDQGRKHFAHSLNGTAYATPRLLIALLENHQQADGKIAVPKALVKYLGQETIS